MVVSGRIYLYLNDLYLNDYILRLVRFITQHLKYLIGTYLALLDMGSLHAVETIPTALRNATCCALWNYIP